MKTPGSRPNRPVTNPKSWNFHGFGAPGSRRKAMSIQPTDQQPITTADKLIAPAFGPARDHT